MPQCSRHVCELCRLVQVDFLGIVLDRAASEHKEYKLHDIAQLHLCTPTQYVRSVHNDHHHNGSAMNCTPHGVPSHAS